MDHGFDIQQSKIPFKLQDPINRFSYLYATSPNDYL